jgi:hypothetical protein
LFVRDGGVAGGGGFQFEVQAHFFREVSVHLFAASQVSEATPELGEPVHVR